MIKVNGQFPGPSLKFDKDDGLSLQSDATGAVLVGPHGETGEYLKWALMRHERYHSHSRGTLEDGLYGPLLIRQVAPTY